MTASEVVRLDGTAFASWLRENRVKYSVSCEHVGRYLGVATEAVEGYEKGYFCREVLRRELARFFEGMGQTPQLRIKDKAEAQTAGSVSSSEPEAEPDAEQPREDAAAPAPEAWEQKASGFGAWMKMQRKVLGMRQDEFARELDFGSRTCISQIERGMWKTSSKKQQHIRKRVEQLLRDKGMVLYSSASLSPAAEARSTADPVVEDELMQHIGLFDEAVDDDFSRAYARMSLLVYQGLYKLNKMGAYKMRRCLQELLSDEDNLEPHYCGSGNNWKARKTINE